MIRLRDHAVEVLRTSVLVEVVQRREHRVCLVGADRQLDHHQSLREPYVVPADRRTALEQIVAAPEEVEELLVVATLPGVVTNERNPRLEKVDRIGIVLAPGPTIRARRGHLSHLAEGGANDAHLDPEPLGVRWSGSGRLIGGLTGRHGSRRRIWASRSRRETLGRGDSLMAYLEKVG